jgi:hypothetical protein
MILPSFVWDRPEGRIGDSDRSLATGVDGWTEMSALGIFSRKKGKGGRVFFGQISPPPNHRMPAPVGGCAEECPLKILILFLRIKSPVASALERKTPPT